MRITKCDICKKTIENAPKSIYIGLGGFFSNSFEICENCGKPIIKLLKYKKLIDTKKEKDGKKK